MYIYIFPGGSVIKNPPAYAGDAGDLGLIPGSGRPLRRKWQPTPVLLTGESRGQRSLLGYSPRGSKQVDTVSDKAHTRVYKTPNAADFSDGIK